MFNLKSLLILLISSVLISCNYEKGDSGGSSLISNHKKADNSWTLTAPTANTYITGTNLTIRIKHSYKVTVTGNPRIPITLDSGNVNAAYVGGSGSQTLIFRYTVQAGDDDTNGIAIASSIDLNGGTLKFNDGNGIVNATTTLPGASTSGVKVDTAGPSVTDLTPLNVVFPITFYNNQDFRFMVTFDDPVVVTGVPQVPVDIGGTTVQANYISGSNTAQLVFSYTVTNTDVDTDGVDILSPIGLNGGTIKDTTGNDADLVLPASTIPTNQHYVDGDSPYVTIVAPPANDTYFPGEIMTFQLTFSENVDVTGTPRIPVSIGASSVYANYTSGTGTNILAFQYVPITGDVDSDGVAIGPMIDFNGGTIQDQDGGTTDAVPLMYPPITPDVLVDGTLPQVTSINPPTDNLYLETETFYVTLNFNVNVGVTGTPRIPMLINSDDPTLVYLNYSSGSGTTNLIFSYVVQNGNEDLDGIALQSPIDLNGGIIQGIVNGVNADLAITTPIAAIDTSAVQMDAKAPDLLSFTPPVDQNYTTGNPIDFVVSFHEPVNVTGLPRLALDIGGVTQYADYSAGTGTTDLTFTYTVQAGDLDDNGIELTSLLIDLNGGTMVDAVPLNAELDFTAFAPDLTGVKVNYDPPVITSITPPLDQYYNEAEVLGFTVNTNVPIDITAGTPRIQLDIGGQTQYANYISGTGTNALYFALSVPQGLEDHDGITMVSPIDSNGATLRDPLLNDLDLTYTLPDTSNIFVDSIIPYIVNITVPAPDTYILNEDLDFILNYNENVDVTGTPRIAVDIGGVTKYLDYVSGTGTNALTFRYTIVAPDEDINGISFVGSTIDLNGGTIIDIGTNNTDVNLDAFTALPSLAAILVDAIVPTITSVTPPANQMYINADTLDFVVNFDDNVDISNTPRIPITLTTGTVYADYLSGTGTNAITFRYTVGGVDEDQDGIELVSPLDLNTTGLIQDVNGNDSELTYTLPVTSSIFVDGILPIVTIDPTSTINASNVNPYTITGTCTENGRVVTVDVGGVSATPTCTANAWTYTQDVSAVAESTVNTVADVAITADQDDAAGNDAVQATDTVIKDTVIPTVSANNITANTYIIGNSIDVVVDFNENVTATGSERILLTFDTEAVSPVYADYSSGTGTNQLTFSYTIIEGDEDINGIVGAASIDLNIIGLIEDANNNETDYNLVTTSFPTVLVDGIRPQITNTTIAANTYYINDQIDVVVTYDDNVTVAGGTPEVPFVFETEAASPAAAYASGSGSNTLTFSWTAVNGNEDTNGANTDANISLAGATIQDANGNDAYLNLFATSFPAVFVDSILPTVTIDPAATIDASNVTAYTLTGTCSENGQAVTVNIGGVADSDTCAGGTWSTTTNVSAASESTVNTVADVAITADHQDAGANAAIQATDTVIKDTVLPNATADAIAANTYIIGDTVAVVVDYNENVTIAGSPRVQLTFETMASAPVYADYASGDGTNQLTFEYTVQDGDEDTNGIIAAASIDPNGGSIVDANSNESTYGLVTSSYATALVDGIRPVVTGVAIAANTYYISDQIDVVVTFDDSVTVAGGSPEFEFTFETETGGPKAVYASGSTTANLTFSYTAINGNEDTNGVDLAASIALAGSTIQDANGNDVVLTLSTTNFPTVLVDAIQPTVTIDPTSTINATNVTTYNLTGTCSENGQAVTVNIGGVADSDTCAGGTWSTTTNVSAASESTVNTVADVAITADHQDAGANAAIQATDTVIKDTVLPNATADVIAANTYIIGDTVAVVVDYNENVTVGGSPRIQLTFETMAAAPVYADYASGDGTNQLTFEYTIQDGDEDANGIAAAASIDANGGSLTDANGNESTYGLVTSAYPTALVDGIRPIVNNVTIAANTYYATDTLSVSVQFDDTVTVAGGSPEFDFTFGTESGGPKAVYGSGTGSNTLQFDYTVVAGNEDTDGIDLAAAISLAGATIQDANGNNAVLTLSTTNFPAVLVDAIQPEVTIDPTSTIDASNVAAYTLTGTCSENGQTVTVNIGGVADSDTCAAGTWSTTTNVTAASESAVNTVADVAITADHQDAGANPAIQATDTVIKDTVLPNATADAVTAQTYIIGDTVAVVVDYNENVTVGGSPRIQLTFETMAASPVYADYASGDGTNQLTFEYTIQNGDEDTNGIAAAASIDANGGSLTDANGNESTYGLVTSAYPTALVDGIRPQVNLVTIAANTYYATDALTVSVQFDDTVTVAGGSPEFDFTFGTEVGGPKAVYGSGTGSNTLQFDYTVAAGNEDTDGIDLAAAISLAGATIQDANGNDAVLTLSTTNFPAVLIDAIQPTVTLDPAVTIYSGNVATYNLSGTCSENGQAVNVNIGGVADSDTCTGGAWSTTTDVSGASESADTSIADVAITADHQDAGANAAIQQTDTVIKDTVLPNPSANAVTANTYAIGDTINVTVDFAENITAIGVERIQLTFETMSVPPVYAAYTGGTGTTQLTFAYTVQDGDEDVNGLAAAASIDLNTTGAIMDMNGNESNYSLVTTAFPTALVDGVRPQVSAVAIAANTYYATDTLSTTITFDDNVTVAGGSPEFDFTFGTESGGPKAVYASGTGSTDLVFDYTVVAGNEDTDGIDLAASIALAGATIQDANGNDAVLTLSTTNFPTVLVDAIQPTVTLDPTVTIFSGNVAAYNLTGTCSEEGQAVNVNIGGVADSDTCTGGAWSTTTNVAAASESADNTLADVAITVDHQDAGANPAIQQTDTVIKDTVAPTISANSIAANTYVATDAIDLVVDFSEEVDLNTTERIQLTFETMASAPVYATYSSGDNSNQVTFSYTVASGDEDTNGIAAAAAIDLNGGAIVDVNGNSANLALATTAFASALVDGIGPSVSSVSITANTYYATDTLSVSVQFDDVVTVAGGTPIIDLTFDTEVGGPSVAYSGGSGSNTLTFDYTVAVGNEDTDGIDLAASINLAGATIQDANGNNADLTLSPTNFASVLIDAIQPTVTIDAAATITNANETTYSLTGTCSENGQTVSVNIGGVADSDTCTALAWSTTTDVSAASESADNTVADVAITADHQDAGSNPATQATDTVIKDSINPIVTTNTANSGSLTTGQTLTLTVNYAEDITVAGGTPYISVTLNSGVVQADYVSGSGSSALVFEYDIQSSDSDPDGIALAASITANGATIEDNVGNTANLNLTTTAFPATTVVQTVTLAYADTSTYDFGQKNVGSSTDVTMIINYSGTIDATSVSASNPSAQFNFKDGSFPGTGGTCSATVNGNCTVVLTFSPDSGVVFNSTVTISYNNGSGMVNIDRNVTGEGVSTTPTKIAAIGPTGIITGDCIPFTIESQTDDDQAANVSGNENVSLVVNNGTGTFYSNSGCSTTTTTATISNGTSSTPLYFSTATPGQELTLVFNAASLQNTTKVVISSNEPVDLYANASAEIETDQCTMVEVSLFRCQWC
jgi:hypothetical protein